MVNAVIACAEILGLTAGIQVIILLIGVQDDTINKAVTIKKFRRDYIDNYVLDELYNRLFSNLSLKNLTEILNDCNIAMSSQSDSEINSAKIELDNIDNKINNLLDLVRTEVVKINTIKPKLRELEQQKQNLEVMIKNLELKNKLSAISEEQIKEIIMKSGEFIKTRNISESKNFINSYIEKVIVYNNKVIVPKNRQKIKQ